VEAVRVDVSLSVTAYPETDVRGHLADVARAADDGGLHTVWVADHLLQAAPGTSPDDPMLEALTTLGFLAGRSERVRLGTMVAAVTYRAPALLIKAVTSLDALSGGRAWLGIGAGYHEAEAAELGLDLPPVPERYERLEQALQLAGRMWSGEAHPVPLRRPPVLIGGMGERRTLRLVARYADACNLFDIPDGGATIRRKLDVLKRHCEAVGRPYEAIEKTVSTRLNPGETVADRLTYLESLGLEHAVFITSGPWSEEGVVALSATA
jgi:alkanesulfonate monooxygenase SsuD/methylene tetrahydromethanopterin reductase-like flavin-dependent oxidoreductase (luciferase family)